MDPYTRETVVERRAFAVHWSAVFAGALVAAGLWLMLQLLGTGVGLGINAWSIVACIGALFAGGYVAARLSQSRDKLVGGVHGLLTWAFTAVLGFTAVVGVSAASRHREVAPAIDRDPVALATDLESSLLPVNAQQRELGKPVVMVDQIVDSAHGANPDAIDTAKLADRLAAVSTLTRAEALDVWARIGGSTGDVIDRSNRLAIEEGRMDRQRAMFAHTLLAGGIALLFGLAAALLGSQLAARRFTRRIDHTAPYPIVTE